MDYAHTSAAARARHRKAQTLARWCYARGILGGLSDQPPALQRVIARQAGVRPPHHSDCRSETWQLVDELLSARVVWDRVHGMIPPSGVADVAAAVDSAAPSSAHV